MAYKRLLNWAGIGTFFIYGICVDRSIALNGPGTRLPGGGFVLSPS